MTWEDTMQEAYARHVREECLFTKAGQPIREGMVWDRIRPRCCDKAIVFHATCVCAFRFCCLEHGHQCVGSHE